MVAGELEPTAGAVWRHPNLRIAAVAQHAFTHLEHHLDKTPNQYIQWRFAAGEDREGLAYAARQVRWCTAGWLGESTRDSARVCWGLPLYDTDTHTHSHSHGQAE